MYEKDLATSSDNQTLVKRDFLKKYISFIKAQKSPVMTNDAVELASLMYANFR
jgi:DNA replicative helicase MCM subunit Mcm2 (Cdc46/Mcm family)